MFDFWDILGVWKFCQAPYFWWKLSFFHLPRFYNQKLFDQNFQGAPWSKTNMTVLKSQSIFWFWTNQNRFLVRTSQEVRSAFVSTSSDWNGTFFPTAHAISKHEKGIFIYLYEMKQWLGKLASSESIDDLSLHPPSFELGKSACL